MEDFKSQIESFDKDNMVDSICSLPGQILDTIDIAKNLTINNMNFKNIIICGMGGSAIGGDVVKSLISDSSHLPFFVNRDYSLPQWVDQHTLIVVSSFSGNTEEAISCFNLSVEKGCNPIIITTGGKLMELAELNNCEVLKIPNNPYQPRAAIGYSVTILLSLLSKLNIVDIEVKNVLTNTCKLLDELNNEYKKLSNQNEAYKLSQKIYNKIPILYSSSNMEVIAYRFRCQLAENAKIISTHLSFPEQNHNEIEAFINSNVENFIIIWLDSSYNHKQIIKRMNITQDILNNVNQVSLKSIISNMESKIERLNVVNEFRLLPLMFSLICFLDWVSFYAAIINKTNPTEIPNIKQIKSLL